MNLLLSHFINRDKIPYKYYSEIELFYPSTKHRIDGLLFVTKSLLKCININVKTYCIRSRLSNKEKNLVDILIRSIEKSNFLLLDFSNGFFKRGRANSELIARKMMKYLDLPNSYLLCVGTNWIGKTLIRKLPISLKYKDRNFSTNNTAFISPFLLDVIFGFDFLTSDILKNIISSNIARKHGDLKKIIHSTTIIKKLKFYYTDDFLKKAQNFNLNKWLK